MESHYFRSVLALADLPYFALRDERLVLRDPSLGPVVDVHCHLALSFGLRTWIDLTRETARAEHYLPMDRPLDLDLYANLNFTPRDLGRLKRDLTLASFTPWGMRATHTAANLAREMRELNVAASVLLPLDFPFLSRNTEEWVAAARRYPGLVCFGSVHPYTPDLAGALDRQVSLGIRGVKVHPAVQMVPPEDRRAVRLYRLCGERKLPVLIHCGPVGIETRAGRWLTQVERYRRPIEACPDTIFILGHSGALQMEEALRLHQRYENAWLEIASQSFPAVQRILREGDPERILFGSDWPFYHQAVPLAKVLLATEGDPRLRARVLHENAARLLRLGDLAKQRITA